MKTKSIRNPLYWAVTVFMVLFLLRPSRACVAAPDPCQFSNHAAVPINQITNIVSTPNELTPETQDADRGKVFGPIIFFAIILAVVGYIIYQLIKLLDKVIPPPEKKPDPPPNSGDTNRPPIVINPLHGPGPALTTLSHTKDLVNTNRVWGTIPYYDIHQLNYLNTCEKFSGAQIFDSFWSSGMLTSTNNSDWEDTHYRIDCYVCSAVGGVLYAYYHYGTNFYNCYYTGGYVASNQIAPAYFNLTDKPYRPVQFFRLNPN